MRIKIAGISIPLTVDFAEQENVRETESRVAELYRNWRTTFPSRSEQEILAMMTYQYASYYLTLAKDRENTIRALQECDQRLTDAILPD